VNLWEWLAVHLERKKLIVPSVPRLVMCGGL